MGAAVAKSVEEFADIPKPKAELRLAAAELFILRWAPSPGADTGIWDAEAVCANRGFLSAVDEILLLKEIDAFPMASPARGRMDRALGVAMSRLMEEFLLLRVWDASQLAGLTGLRFSGEKQLSGSASLAFPRDCSATTEELSLSTSDEFYASGQSHSSRPDMLAVVVDGNFLDEHDLICSKSLPVLHKIALRVIQAGYTEELLQTFTKAPCDIIDRFLSILRVERRSLEVDKISFEEAEWWTTEDMMKRWILVTKLVEKALVVMQRQLQAQVCGAFDRFKNDYFLTIARQSIFILLKFADGFGSTQSPENLIYVLEIFEALSDSAPGLLLLFTGEHVELISRQVTVVLANIALSLRKAISEHITKVRTDCSHPENGIRGVGVHPLTRYAMICVELLAPHRTALDSILANGDEDGRVTSFGSLVSELITALECNLEEKSAIACAVGGGSAHLFLANNTSFVLHRATDADVASLLGDEWVARRRSLLDLHTAGYVEASWGPVAACLENVAGGKSAKALAKFNIAFKKAHGSQACREVPDPALRAALMKAVSGMVVPAYVAFLQKHPKLANAVRYTADDLAESLSELFEGEAAGARKS